MTSEFPSYFLFSIDLEDLRRLADRGSEVGERLPELVCEILAFLDRHSKKCTFFVVGETARDYPDILRDIYNRGHEIACHTDRHITLDKQSPENFEKDLVLNIESITSIGIPAPVGFRAPSLSLTSKTSWVYEILNRHGFKYSTSVLPAANPLFGWPEFGELPKLQHGVWEIPISLTTFPALRIPMGAGIYFRVLPALVLKYLFMQKKAKNEDVVGYFHPYDFDKNQPRIMHPGINNNRFYNWLMYYNRSSMYVRLEQTLKQGFEITTYKDYINLKQFA